MPIVSCENCSANFSAKPYWIKKGYGRFCTSACQYQSARKGKEVPCDGCGKMSYKQPKALEGSKSGKFFCGKSCQTKWRNQLYIGERHKNFKTGIHVYRAKMKRHKIPEVCTLCATVDTRVLAVHHIDKNRRNNELQNLAWLCHNCHFLVHHYEGERAIFMATIV